MWRFHSSNRSKCNSWDESARARTDRDAGQTWAPSPTPRLRCLIESITYTESGRPNLKLISKEYCLRELRKMLGADSPPEQRANDFSQYTDAELLAELDRVANELGIKTASMIEPSDAPIAPP